MTALYSLIRELIDIPSVTGDELVIAQFLEGELVRRGFTVRLQEVEPERFNVFAHSVESVGVVLCTHLDTVAPFTASSEDADFVYGRGACDAKGVLATMVLAAEQLHNDGVHGIGLLFVVGEEVDSAGARKANELGINPRYVIVGEPTENQLASGHKGGFEFLLRAEGIAAHSAYPEHGDSAIDRLLTALDRIRQADWGESPLLGSATVNIGTVSGGVAGNVIAPHAESRVFVRLVGPVAEARATIDGIVNRETRLSYEVTTESEAVECETIEGLDATPVAFGSDIPALTAFGKPLLLGPGSIHDAHTDGEKIAKQQALEAVDLYYRIARHFLEIPA